MSFVKNNVESTNMDFSVCVLYNLYTSLRIFKQGIVSCIAKLEGKSYRTVVQVENEAGKKSYYQYYLCEPALEYFEQALLEDYGIKSHRDEYELRHPKKVVKEL